MSNKKRIAKKAKEKSFHSLKKEFGIRLALLEIENRFLRQQIALVQSQRTASNYPSGVYNGNPLIDGIAEKRLELVKYGVFAQRETKPNFRVVLLRSMQEKAIKSQEDFEREYYNNPNTASDQRERSGKIF